LTITHPNFPYPSGSVTIINVLAKAVVNQLCLLTSFLLYSLENVFKIIEETKGNTCTNNAKIFSCYGYN
jgi:hypothetical protein